MGTIFMKTTGRSLAAAIKGLFLRERGLPSLDRVIAILSLLGLAVLCYVLGAAAMFYRLPTSNYLQNSFIGANAWWLRGQRTDASRTPASTPARNTVLIDKPAQTDDGFTLYTTSAGSWAALIDMKANIVHRWQLPFSQSLLRHVNNPLPDKQVCWFGCHLYPNGDLLAIYHADGDTPYGYGLIKLDKDSNLLWGFADRVHHAVDVGDDGTIYTLTHKTTTEKPANLEFLPASHLADSLVILSAEGKKLDEMPIMEALRDSPYAATQRLLFSQAVAPDDFTHANSVRILRKGLASSFPMFKEGQVLISLRNMNTLVVFDVPKRSAAWAAQGVWRMQHAAEFLDNGRLLLYDNTGGNTQARVLEFDPRNQSLPWAYVNEDSVPFQAVDRGAEQRLPNGNTLIVDPFKSRLFEVSPAREVVWEALCLEPVGQAKEAMVLDARINAARRYWAEQLTFLKGGPHVRP